MSIQDTRIPYIVTFYSGTFFETHKTDRDTDAFGFSGTNASRSIVTKYVDQVSWSFSTMSPYETISLTLTIPLEEIPTVFPGEHLSRKDKVKLTPGFWITVHAKGLEGTPGRMLCWGRVDTLNVSTYSDQQGGSVSTNVSLSASSWVNYLDANSFFATEADSDTFAERPLTQETTRLGRAVYWDKFDNAAIKESEFNKFVEGFRATSNIPKEEEDRNDFYGYDNDYALADRLFHGENFLQSCLGKAVSALYHAFAGDVYLPLSVGKTDKDTIIRNFGELVPVLYGTRAAFTTNTGNSSTEHPKKGIRQDPVFSLVTNIHDKTVYNSRSGEAVNSSFSFVETDRSLVDLSRFGNHAAPPLGVSGNFLVRDFDGGVWTWMTKTFGIDPNLVEMFPTLIEIDTEHYLDRHKEAFRKLIMVREKTKVPAIDDEGNEIKGKLVTQIAYHAESHAVQNSPVAFGKNKDGVFVAKRGKKKDLKYIIKDADTRPAMFTEFGNPTGGTSIMVPVILYRMKPTYPPDIHATGYHSEAINELIEGAHGNPNDPNSVTLNYAPDPEDRDSVFTANRYPHFCLMQGQRNALGESFIKKGRSGHIGGSSDATGVHTTQPATLSKHEIIVKADQITSLNFTVSENDRVNMVSVRNPAAASTNLQFGYGYSSIRRPIKNPMSIADYGIRRQEVTWNIIYADQTMYHALTEYAFDVFQNNSGHKTNGSFSCELNPEIRAGMYIKAEAGRGEVSLTYQMYVEEVSHSVIIDPDGGYIGDTQVTFSQGSANYDGTTTTLGMSPMRQPYQ